jgi:hypothetical protein
MVFAPAALRASATVERLTPIVAAMAQLDLAGFSAIAAAARSTDLFLLGAR